MSLIRDSIQQNSSDYYGSRALYRVATNVVTRKDEDESYIFKAKHIPGKDNTVADWLSRMYPINSILSEESQCMIHGSS